MNTAVQLLGATPFLICLDVDVSSANTFSLYIPVLTLYQLSAAIFKDSVHARYLIKQLKAILIA